MNITLCAECAPKVREAASTGREVALCASCSEAAERATEIGRMPIAVPCPTLVPVPHTQAGERCERGQHPETIPHRVAPKNGKPGAVWNEYPGSRHVMPPIKR